jgi:quercetin dioxygenase-like cupin family protein
MKLIVKIALLGLVGLARGDAQKAEHPLGQRAATEAQGKVMLKIEITRSGSTPATSAPSEHFVGSVHVVPLFRSDDPLQAAAASVTFEPGARTAWHTHPVGQILIVTAGEGWVQQWGGPVEVIRQGDVARIPPGVKHWHGATATTSMTHTAIVEPRGGKTVDWMEQVSSDQYHGPQP